MSLYTEMVEAGVEVDNHESDLYVKKSPEALKILEAHETKFVAFRHQVTRDWWFDIPFMFDPWWEAKPKG